MGYEDEVAAALARLGAEEGAVADAIADPGGAARALEGERLLLRAAPELSASAPGYAPEPRPPVWLRLSRGEREVTVAALRGDYAVVRRAARVEVETAEERCCDAASCSLDRRVAWAWLHLEGAGLPPSRVLVAEQRAPAAEEAAAPGLFAHRLASFVGVSAELSSGALFAAPLEGSAEAALPPPLGPIAPVDLARFALRGEGERVVLRDLAGLGPRKTARRNALIGAALCVVAAFFWFQLSRALRDGATSAAFAHGAAAALFSLAGYAFLGVARFSARYRAESSPLVALGRDRFIVLPWVSRTGAVDLRPEGRLGAAIPLGELRDVAVRARDGRFAVELDSDHGPIDALPTPREEVARYWSAALARVAAEVRHPSAGASARQRARAKNRG